MFAFEINRKPLFQFSAGCIELRVAQNAFVEFLTQLTFAFARDRDVDLCALYLC